MGSDSEKKEGQSAGQSEEKRLQIPVDEPPVVTHHTINIKGKKLKYKVTTGMMPLRDAKGELEAGIFYMAYTKEDVADSAKRPLTFSFNGGPGSASVWLHMGTIGPKRVEMTKDGFLPPPPYKLSENEYTWLEDTDIVFIDPVGTGYSRAVTPEKGEKFWSFQGDIESVSEFIRLYLGRSERWGSPLYIVGESYGTLRAAGIAGHLTDRGVAFNGIMLVSSVLQYDSLNGSKANQLPYLLFLPTYTATAAYHGKLDAKLAKNLRSTLHEVEEWAIGEYATGLLKGDAISDKDKKNIIAKLAKYTGLSEAFIERANLRIKPMAFAKELLRDQGRTVGRLDSRFQGMDDDDNGATPEFDSSMSAIINTYTTLFNQYVRNELGYKSDWEYYILGGGIEKPWDFKTAARLGLPETSSALRNALVKNPYMKVLVASGFYDLATPYFATYYTLNHMGLDPSLHANFTKTEYAGGHMMYIEHECLKQLKKDVAEFIKSTSNV